jgi:hypothetical protein
VSRPLGGFRVTPWDSTGELLRSQKGEDKAGDAA